MGFIMRNRYGDTYSFELVEENVYHITGELKYWRFGGNENEERIDYNNLGFVDPSGGPFMTRGYLIEGKPVTRIFLVGEEIRFEVK